MKNFKVLSVAAFILGACFLLPVGAMAADANDVQPAAILSLENYVIDRGSWLESTVGWKFNETVYFTDIQVGKQGVGGVTAFNGTIINNTTGEYGGGIPVTFGDDVRIDGEIWRGVSKGVSDNMPLKISDTMVPTMDDINDLGSADRRWQDIYFADGLYGNGELILGVRELASPGPAEAIGTEIHVSANSRTIFNSIPMLQGVESTGYYHINHSLGNEVAIGDFEFDADGQKQRSVGYFQYHEASSNLLTIGLFDNMNGDGPESVIMAVDMSSIDEEGGGNANLRVTANTLTLGGHNVNIEGGNVNIREINTMRFKHNTIRNGSGGGCEMEVEIDNGIAWQMVDEGVLAWGDIGGTGLFACMGGAWMPLIN